MCLIFVIDYFYSWVIYFMVCYCSWNKPLYCFYVSLVFFVLIICTVDKDWLISNLIGFVKARMIWNSSWFIFVVVFQCFLYDISYWISSCSFTRCLDRLQISLHFLLLRDDLHFYFHVWFYACYCCFCCGCSTSYFTFHWSHPHLLQLDLILVLLCLSRVASRLLCIFCNFWCIIFRLL